MPTDRKQCSFCTQTPWPGGGPSARPGEIVCPVCNLAIPPDLAQKLSDQAQEAAAWTESTDPLDLPLTRVASTQSESATPALRMPSRGWNDPQRPKHDPNGWNDPQRSDR